MDNPVHEAEKSSPFLPYGCPRKSLRSWADQEFEIYSFREMMNRLQEGIYITDSKGITLYINSAFVHLSGLSREDLIGKRVHDMRDNGILPNSCCAKVYRNPPSGYDNQQLLPRPEMPGFRFPRFRSRRKFDTHHCRCQRCVGTGRNGGESYPN